MKTKDSKKNRLEEVVKEDKKKKKEREVAITDAIVATNVTRRRCCCLLPRLLVDIIATIVVAVSTIAVAARRRIENIEAAAGKREMTDKEGDISSWRSQKYPEVRCRREEDDTASARLMLLRSHTDLIPRRRCARQLLVATFNGDYHILDTDHESHIHGVVSLLESGRNLHIETVNPHQSPIASFPSRTGLCYHNEGFELHEDLRERDPCQKHVINLKVFPRRTLPYTICHL